MVTLYKQKPTDQNIESMIEAVSESVSSRDLLLPLEDKKELYVERERFHEAYEVLL